MASYEYFQSPLPLWLPTALTDDGAAISYLQAFLLFWRTRQWQFDVTVKWVLGSTGENADLTASQPGLPTVDAPVDEIEVAVNTWLGFTAPAAAPWVFSAATVAVGNANVSTNFGTSYEFDGTNWLVEGYLNIFSPTEWGPIVQAKIPWVWSGTSPSTLRADVTGATGMITFLGETYIYTASASIVPVAWWEWDGRYSAVTGEPVP